MSLAEVEIIFEDGETLTKTWAHVPELGSTFEMVLKGEVVVYKVIKSHFSFVFEGTKLARNNASVSLWVEKFVPEEERQKIIDRAIQNNKGVHELGEILRREAREELREITKTINDVRKQSGKKKL